MMTIETRVTSERFLVLSERKRKRERFDAMET